MSASGVSCSAWGTPTARDWKDGAADLTNVPENGLLGRMAANWSALRASDGEKGGPNQKFGAGGGELLLNGQAEAISLRSILPDHPISTVGEDSSHIRRSLNPLFVEWLMGWPPGWTSQALTPPASNACACSVMALSLFKQRMRFALSQLGSPDDLPVQQSLFA
jgi:hypothetical protein